MTCFLTLVSQKLLIVSIKLTIVHFYSFKRKLAYPYLTNPITINCFIYCFVVNFLFSFMKQQRYQICLTVCNNEKRVFYQSSIRQNPIYKYFLQQFLNRIMNKNKLQKYQKMDKLGEGAYGIVYKARDKETNQIYALKKIRLENQQEGIPSTAIREISILKELKHPNVVNLREVIHSPKKLTLVFQYLDYDLKKYMGNFSKQIGMDPKIVKSFCYQLLQGIKHCHEKKVLHRDLKPQNLLISKDNVLKIADFGLARASGIPVKGYTHEVVTLWYRPPDVLLGSQKYSDSIDIWSVGCIFGQMVNLRPLFPGQKQQDQLIRIFKVFGTPNETTWPGVDLLPHWKNYQFEKYDPVPLEMIVPRLDEKGVDLLKKMLRPNPALRITAKDALQHEYFSDLSEDVLSLYKH